MRLDYNIEYAHIYTSQTWGAEQKKSIDVLKNLNLKNSIRGILIDDYNEPEAVLDINKFVDYLDTAGAKPDFIVMESKLVPLAHLLLNHLSPQHKSKWQSRFQELGRINCSFLEAAWQLARLGQLSTPEIENLAGSEQFVAEKTMTILPHKYESNEQNALDVIKLTHFASFTSKIEYIFFD